MIKRYHEYLESLDEEKDMYLTLQFKDFDADYNFHKNITPYFEKAEEYLEELKIAFRGGVGYSVKCENYDKLLRELNSKIFEYFFNTLKDNNFTCIKYSRLGLGIKHYVADIHSYVFFGKKSELEKINRYYGIMDDKNISNKVPGILFGGWHRMNISESHTKSSNTAICLSLSDLKADREFYVNIFPLVEETELLWDGNQCTHAIDSYSNYVDSTNNLVNSVNNYINKIFANNNLKCSNYLFDIADDNRSLYAMYFVGDKSDLEKINKYYGITDYKNYLDPESINGDRTHL